MADQPEPPADAPTPPPRPTPLKPRPRPGVMTQNLSDVVKLAQTQALPSRARSGGATPATTTNLTDLVKLAKQVSALSEAEDARAAASQEAASRKAKKFSRTGTPDGRALTQALRLPEPDEAVPIAAPAAPPVEPLSPAPPPAPPALPAADWPRLVKAEQPPAQVPAAARRVAKGTARGPAVKPQDNLWVWAAVQAFGFSLIALGYWFGQMGAAAPAKPAEPAVPAAQVSARGLEAADAALSAEQAGDTARARLLYEAALTQKPPLPGASYRLALLALRRGDFAGAETLLTRSVAAGEEPAACAYLRARTAANRGDFDESVRQLQAAAHAAPLDGRYYFYLGEALRRQGKAGPAAEALAQALARPSRAEDRQLYEFKRRLLWAAGGNDEVFNGSLAEHLRQQPNDGEWQLLAAARDAARGAIPDATGHLKRAAVLPPGRYAALTADYQFKSLVPPPPASDRTDPAEKLGGIVDPATAAPEQADPAVWFLPPPAPLE